MPTAIEFENISKQYRLGLVSTRTLSHDLNRWFQMNIRGKDDPYQKIGEVNDRAHRGESDFVWALKDINFKVEQGDVLGVIGKNGAGKSTLLKILSKVTSPTNGTIRARGRIASLLEVGTGFHPEMTGRENIFMNGAIMGMTKSEIRRKLDEIVDFSGVERYLDTPVKRYSSGMTVRLGFAIAAHLDPEILVVDEVLAVGDAEFQKKAIGKMQDVSKGEGRTVLFVSHNMGAVQNMCTKGILLNNGSISFSGTALDAVNTYVGSKSQHLDSQTVVRVMNKAISIDDYVVDLDGASTDKPGRRINLSIKGELQIPMNISLEVMLYDEYDTLIGMYSPTHFYGTTDNLQSGNFHIKGDFYIPEILNNGTYYLNARLSQMNIEYLVEIYRIASVEVDSQVSTVTGVAFNNNYFGLLSLK